MFWKFQDQMKHKQKGERKKEGMMGERKKEGPIGEEEGYDWSFKEYGEE